MKASLGFGGYWFCINESYVDVTDDVGLLKDTVHLPDGVVLIDAARVLAQREGLGTFQKYWLQQSLFNLLALSRQD